MQFATIASGSSGNCLYVANVDTHILIDAGISKKRIEAGLQSFGVDPCLVDGILVTHEHIDHVQGVGVWARKYHVPIYATAGTLEELKRNASLGKIEETLFRVIRSEEMFELGTMKIYPFSMSHDARDPVSYRVEDKEHRIGMVTDLGYYDEYIVRALTDCDLLYVEANHDEHMLQTGPYPYALKCRIAGNYGHLCNEEAGQLIERLLNPRLQQVVLGHLSKDNNYPALALQAVRNELPRDGEEALPKISVAPRECAMTLIDLSMSLSNKTGH